jgi:tetratricopeptide (TPR) repeat protein
MKMFWCLPLLALAAGAATPTPAEFAIQNAQSEIAQHADFYGGYNHLAMAYARRARETGDAEFYAKAEAPLRRSLALSPDNYEGRKTEVFLLLGKREWTAALEAATKLNKQTPDDVAIYGYMADAEIALGDYKAAVENTQWMLNLRPGNAPAFLRAGLLREAYKDWKGALEILQMAYEGTPFAEREERAWVLVQMARVNLELGDAAAAQDAVHEALGLFPDYHLALAMQRRIQAAASR